MDVVIGIDTGTTATKGVAAGPDGTIRALTSVHYPLSVPAPGRAELDPVALRNAAVKALIDVAAACRENGDRVIAVGLSAFLHALVPMDPAGQPLGPLVTWADARAGQQSDDIVASGAGKRLQARTGTPVHPMSPLTKLAWWRENDPKALAEAPRWGGVKELVLAGLADAPYAVDLSIASGTGLYDIHERRWDPEALEIAGVRLDQLAEVLPTTTQLTLRADVAAAAGLDPGTPLIIGAADGPLANLGVGATPAGVAAISLGTSGALRTVVDRPTADKDGRLFCYALTEDRWVIGGAVNNAGSVVRWAGESFAAGFERPGAEGEDADERDAALLIEAQGVAPGSDGLLCLPYLLGERAPWWRPGLRGAYLGLRREHGRAHLVRSAVEGVCQQLALVRDSFTAEGIAVTEVRATGGAGRVGALGRRARRGARPAGLGRRHPGGHRARRLPAGPARDRRAARPRRGGGPGAAGRAHRARPGQRRALRPAAPARRDVRPGRARRGQGARPARPAAAAHHREGRAVLTEAQVTPR